MKKLTFPFLVLFMSCAVVAQVDWQTNTTNVQSFSSPRCTDLNNDGILDAVIGAGLEGEISNRGIVAVDGSDGSFLWFSEARDQIFGSPVFLDINADGTDDVFIGGRGGEFRALNGLNGDLIWEFYNSNDTVSPIDQGIYQFYTPQLIPDQDGDGLQDLLQANGGDPSILLPDEPRPAGKIQIISSQSGALLASAEVPDGQETYMSPLVADFFGDGDLEVIFGTGGEVHFGSLWRVDLADVANSDLSKATAIASSQTKGFIAPPSLTDINDDSVLDVIVNSYDGRVLAISGFDNALLWQVPVTMGETNASPAIGYFNGDNIPDVFSTFSIGLAPTYTNHRQFMIDGSTGIIQWQDSLGVGQFTSPLAIDLDGDFFDEVIYSTNEINNGDFAHKIFTINFTSVSSLTELVSGGGTNINSTPWIGDLDGDDQFDLIYGFQSDSTSFISDNGLSIRKVNVGPIGNAPISWGAYLGSDYTATFENIRSNCADLDDIVLEIVPTSNGDTCATEVIVNSTGCPTPADCEYLWSNGATTQSTVLPTTARQTVRVSHPGGCTKAAKIDFESVRITTETVDSIQCVDDKGSIFIDFDGGFPPYTTSWNGQNSGGTTNTSLYIQSELNAGTYTFEVTDAIGCIFNKEFTLSQPDSLILNTAVREPSSIGSDGQIIYTISGNEPINVTLNGDIVTTDTINNLSYGTYHLQAIDANGCVTDQNIVFEDPVGLHNISEEITFDILSQPSRVIFQFEGLKQNGNILRIYTIQGLPTQSFAIPINGQDLLVETHSWPNGIYIAELQTAQTRKMKRFLLRH